MSQTLHCTNGYKALYRKDLIPDAMKKAAIPMAMKKGFITGAGQEPPFGLFSTGPDYNLRNGAVVVFACLNPKWAFLGRLILSVKLTVAYTKLWRSKWGTAVMNDI